MSGAPFELYCTGKDGHGRMSLFWVEVDHAGTVLGDCAYRSNYSSVERKFWRAGGHVSREICREARDDHAGRPRWRLKCPKGCVDRAMTDENFRSTVSQLVTAGWRGVDVSVLPK